MNHVLDTNVLMVASAHFALPQQRGVTPYEPELREQVFLWLTEFWQAGAIMILDYQNKIYDEYQRNLNPQDYAMQMVRDKIDYCRVLYASVDYDHNGHALLPPELEHKKWDKDDRKFGSVAFAIKQQTGSAEIVNSSDTDWYDVRSVLAASGIGLRQLIEEWCRAKYCEKNGHEPPSV